MDFDYKRVTSIDPKAIEIIETILRQNYMILELLCNPTILQKAAPNEKDTIESALTRTKCEIGA
jgi:hypothetical protein